MAHARAKTRAVAVATACTFALAACLVPSAAARAALTSSGSGTWPGGYERGGHNAVHDCKQQLAGN